MHRIACTTCPPVNMSLTWLPMSLNHFEAQPMPAWRFVGFLVAASRMSLSCSRLGHSQKASTLFQQHFSYFCSTCQFCQMPASTHTSDAQAIKAVELLRNQTSQGLHDAVAVKHCMMHFMLAWSCTLMMSGSSLVLEVMHLSDL